LRSAAASTLGLAAGAGGNHGELLTRRAPCRPSPTPAGAPWSAATATGASSIAGAGPCDAACRKWIVLTRQIHVALYKQMPRVQRTWLTDQARPMTPPCWPSSPTCTPPSPPTPPAPPSTWPAPAPGVCARPAGRIILRYAPDADPRGILKDMERLLRYAWAG
jgi:hypothetical protein